MKRIHKLFASFMLLLMTSITGIGEGLHFLQRDRHDHATATPCHRYPAAAWHADDSEVTTVAAGATHDASNCLICCLLAQVQELPRVSAFSAPNAVVAVRQPGTAQAASSRPVRLYVIRAPPLFSVLA